MDQEPEDRCECCGMCCLRYQGIHWAQGTDLTRWFDTGRRDILQHCRVQDAGGDWVSAADLPRQELVRVSGYAGWCDPVRGEALDTCPFLTRTAENTWICAIHAVKPAICRSYRPWEWAGVMGIDIPCPAVRQMRESR